MINTEQMIADLNQRVAEHCKVSVGEAWEPTLDLLAWHYKIEGSQLPKNFTTLEAKEVVEDYFDAGVYAATSWDCLGEHYYNLQGDRQIAELMPVETANRLARTYADNNPDINSEGPVRILDPNCATGRYLIAAHLIFQDRGFYMGCEGNRIFYKMALLNLFILDIPGALINADGMCANLTDARTWDACNEWV